MRNKTTIMVLLLAACMMVASCGKDPVSPNFGSKKEMNPITQAVSEERSETKLLPDSEMNPDPGRQPHPKTDMREFEIAPVKPDITKFVDAGEISAE